MNKKNFRLKGLVLLLWLPVFCCGIFLTVNASAQNLQDNKMAANATPGEGTPAKPVVAIKAKPQQRKKATKKVAAKPVDTAKTEATPIDEMIVMGMSAQSNNNDPASRIAHPKIGWSNFETYLRDSATSPDKKSGLVKISFLVHEDGTCTNFKVIHTLSKAADQSAIKLIKNGPTWIGSDDGETKETTVTVNFR